MAEETPAEEVQLTFNIKSSGDAKYVLTLPATTTVGELKEKLSTTDYADLPVGRQRLIYSGRVLKDPDTLASIKLKDGNTIHLVKGASSNARQNPTEQNLSSSTAGATPAVPQVPTNIAAGTGNNPLAGLTGARYAGFHGLPGADAFGPDGGMGGPDPEQALRMMEDPNFLSQMNEMFDNPQFLDMILNSPMFRGNPLLTQVLQNPSTRRLMFNPNMIRAQMEMQRAMNQSGSRFPAPGATDTTPQDQQRTTSPQPQGATPNLAANPFASLMGNLGPNPFANLGTTPAASPPATASAGQGTPQQQDTPSAQAGQNNNQPNPFASLFGLANPGNTQNPGSNPQADPIAQMTQQLMQDPEAMNGLMQAMRGMGGGAGNPFGNAPGPAPGAGANPFASLFSGMGAGSPPAPPDNRPPEEIYADQLRQLNDMGFFEFERNIQALRRSGGSVQGAIEYLLNNS